MYYITDKMNDKLRKTSELVADLINSFAIGFLLCINTS